jgi:hypothetical protein
VASVEEQVNAARDIVDATLRHASDLLDAGADTERVHRRYVAASFELREEVEARALLASAGDQGAIRRLEQLVRELHELRKEARAELRDHADGEREA